MSTLDLTPRPAAARARSAWAAQTAMELSLLLRNGEQLLLTLIIPVVLLIGLAKVDRFAVGDLGTLVPGVLAVAVMATAFTSTAIATGFDRRSGVLKFLGSTPLSRGQLAGAKIAAVAVVEALQTLVICATALAMGWSPAGTGWQAALLIGFGTAAFGALAVALAGILRAEATLAVANALFLALLVAGGTIVPAEDMPGPLQSVAHALPSGALASGLRAVLADGTGIPPWTLAVLAAWTAAGIFLSRRTFRWE